MSPSSGKSLRGRACSVARLVDEHVRRLFRQWRVSPGGWRQAAAGPISNGQRTGTATNRLPSPVLAAKPSPHRRPRSVAVRRPPENQSGPSISSSPAHRALVVLVVVPFGLIQRRLQRPQRLQRQHLGQRRNSKLALWLASGEAWACRRVAALSCRVDLLPQSRIWTRRVHVVALANARRPQPAPLGALAPADKRRHQSSRFFCFFLLPSLRPVWGRHGTWRGCSPLTLRLPGMGR